MKKIDLYKEVLKSGFVDEIVLRSRQVDEDNVPDLIIWLGLFTDEHLCGEVGGTLVDSDLDLYESEDETGFSIYQGKTPIKNPSRVQEILSEIFEMPVSLQLM